jgi:predicted glycosyltransferase
MRFLLYSHDALGLGHTRRHLAVAAALAHAAPDASILLATSTDDINRLGLPPNVEVVKLPGLRKVANDHYSSRRLHLPPGEIHSMRAELLLTTVKSFQPAVVLVDKHPFGAGGEFKAGLEALRQQGGRAVLGLRDILDEPARVLAHWKACQMQQRFAEFYDQILIYGEQAVFDPIAEYQFPPFMAEPARFCGYVVNDARPAALDAFGAPLPDRRHPDCPLVLATTGGGEDGSSLLKTFLRAVARAPWQGLVVAGPMMPESELTELKQLADKSGVILRRFVPHLASMFESVDALVCMGGYNTLAEALFQGTPTVCVPRVIPDTDSEQLMRARAFEDLGLLSMIHPDDLNAALLCDAVASILPRSRTALRNQARRLLSCDGARQAARHLLALASGAGDRPVSPPVEVAKRG